MTIGQLYRMTLLCTSICCRQSSKRKYC